MVVNIKLSAETEVLLRKDAEAQGTSPEELLSHYVEDIYAYAIPKDDPDTLRDIGEAVDEYEEMQANDDPGIPASVVYADLRTALTAQRQRAA